MRAAIIAGLMSLAMLPGSADEARQESAPAEVDTACVDACYAKYYQCYYGGGDPYYCTSYRQFCISQCK